MQANADPTPSCGLGSNPTTLSTALRLQMEAGVPVDQAIQDRLRGLEQENQQLKLLLGVGKTLSSAMTEKIFNCSLENAQGLVRQST